MVAEIARPLPRPPARLARSGGARLAVLLLALLAVTLWAGGRMAFRHYLSAGQERAEMALGLTANGLDADLARFEVVPQLIAEFDLIQRLVSHPTDVGLRRAANAWLSAENAAIHASDIYVIRPDGDTIASSNYLDGEASFIGRNFSYRPYFIEAMRGGPGRFYGIGTASSVRGYYFSAPVFDMDGRIAGVVAVKVAVDRIEQSWHDGEYRFLVTDPEGRVFLSSEPRWLSASFEPPTPERLARTIETRRYADAELADLGVERVTRFGVPVLWIASDGEVREYVAVSQPMPRAGWTVHVLLDSAELRREARMAVLTLVLLLCAGVFGALILAQRRAQVAERIAMHQFATAELERRVEARTADLARLNGQLEQEVAERRATESELRAAQASLVQVGKLAALGQMSASLSHEINQPLAAARNYADSAGVLIERGDYAAARENMQHILSLVDRMAAIGRHLRDAARKPDDRLGAVDLAALLPETRTIVAQRLASSGAMLEIDLPPDLPPLKAGPTRLQQVLVNLITNAADAAEGTDDRRITLSASTEGEWIALRLRDRGPGVPEAIAERIFDPFFTTKGMGAGLGLGLSITANIVRDFGGTIAVRNAGPGAEFCVRLPVARPA
ncbi:MULTISPECIES: ATP-binding protein [unclassified Paracoccus (in: a-proteobacteria)]|uniref:sensor histidine kinase n=1 Tax=unclassified Paracoccus (in: a-proteobacteria) TaxID=2688777 RepID=UPI001F3E7CE0|nr:MULTISPECIES: ATP-binding protein [unclassified Paracoccus (in: a-proteobacteria)]